MQQQPEGCRLEQGGQIDAMYALIRPPIEGNCVSPTTRSGGPFISSSSSGPNNGWSKDLELLEEHHEARIISGLSKSLLMLKPLNPGPSDGFGTQWFSNKSASNTAPDPVLQTGRITAVPSIQLNAPFKLNELTQSKLLGEKTNWLFFEIKDRLFVRKYHH